MAATKDDAAAALSRRSFSAASLMPSRLRPRRDSDDGCDEDMALLLPLFFVWHLCRRGFGLDEGRELRNSSYKSLK